MTIQIQGPKDLFLYDLCAMYDVEQRMARMLPLFAQECLDNQGRQAFMLHEQETHQHIRNLEQCFQILGYQPMGIENHAAGGLQADHDSFLQQKPPTEAVSMFVLHAGYLSECLEIAEYHDLIDRANSLGLQNCVQLLQQNLQQEVNASATLAAITHQLSQLQARAVQASAANAPMPNQPAPVPNEPMPNQSQPSSSVNQQAPNQSSTTSTSTNSSQLQESMQVVGADMTKIGRVSDIRDNDFLVDIPMHRDLYVPFSAIQNMDNDRVVLNVQGDQIYDMGWPKPPLV